MSECALLWQKQTMQMNESKNLPIRKKGVLKELVDLLLTWAYLFELLLFMLIRKSTWKIDILKTMVPPKKETNARQKSRKCQKSRKFGLFFPNT